MDCKIMKKGAFTVLCRAKTFQYEDAAAQVPQFWAEHFGTGGGKVVCGMYGICCWPIPVVALPPHWAPSSALEKKNGWLK